MTTLDSGFGGLPWILGAMLLGVLIFAASIALLRGGGRENSAEAPEDETPPKKENRPPA